jgi:hypothetical protein
LLVVFASGGAGGAGGGISGNWPHAKLSYLCCVGQQLKRKNMIMMAQKKQRWKILY